jgi:hypothetical protein
LTVLKRPKLPLLTKQTLEIECRFDLTIIVTKNIEENVEHCFKEQAQFNDEADTNQTFCSVDATNHCHTTEHVVREWHQDCLQHCWRAPEQANLHKSDQAFSPNRQQHAYGNQNNLPETTPASAFASL